MTVFTCALYLCAMWLPRGSVPPPADLLRPQPPPHKARGSPETPVATDTSPGTVPPCPALINKGGRGWPISANQCQSVPISANQCQMPDARCQWGPACFLPLPPAPTYDRVQHTDRAGEGRGVLGRTIKSQQCGCECGG